MIATTRLISIDDAEPLAELQRSGREFFAPWEPIRDESYFTVEGQVADIRVALDRHFRGEGLPHVILGDQQRVIGRITLSGITRGALQSCAIGYWVSPDNNGRGFATAAVRRMTALAFRDLGLHRVQAETLVYNIRSQHVLDRVGFTRFGLAPQYLKIAGQWQDHLMYQLLADAGSMQARTA